MVAVIQDIMPKRLAILGSTGSIGRQALEIAAHLHYPVAVLAAGRDAAALEGQIRQVHPAVAVLYDDAAAADLRIRVADTNTRVLSGREGLCAAASLTELPEAPGLSDMVLNAVVGMVGLEPTLAAIEAGRDIALANKETLVCEALPGLYPCGEGAGYAGGIMTAAVDGVRCAAELMKRYKPCE